MKLLALTLAFCAAALAAAGPPDKRDTCASNNDCSLCYTCIDGLCIADSSCPIDNPPARGKRDTCADNNDCSLCYTCIDGTCIADSSCPIDNPPAV